MALLIRNARVAVDSRKFSQRDLQIDDSRSEDLCFDLDGYQLLPGLINGHDHLEFGLFPRMGSGTYSNWREWAQDIYHPTESPLKELLSIPKETQLWMGGLRNLLCGVTQVAHHNPYYRQYFGHAFPTGVLRHYNWAHSLPVNPITLQTFQQSSQDVPFFLHFAEGTDEETRREFDLLKQSFALDSRLILIHAVGCTEPMLRQLAEQQIGIVCCPSSNVFTLGKTLSQQTILNYPRLMLGSDSPLTAKGDFLDEIRFAHTTLEIPAELLYELATTRAARILALPSSYAERNLIAFQDNGATPAETLLQANYETLECVILDGRLMLLSPALAERVPLASRSHLEPVTIGGIVRLLPIPTRHHLEVGARSSLQSLKLMGTRAIQ